MKLVKGARILNKRSIISGEIPTIPLVPDHTLGWLETDIYEAELFMNLADNRLFSRGLSGITEFPVLDQATGKIKVSDLPTDILGAVRYQGTWDASIGDPPMTGMTADNRGYYWVVNASGTTDLSGDTGTNLWDIGDWAIYDGVKWGIVDNNGIIDSSDTVYVNPAYPSLTTVKSALDQLLYVEPNINTFSISPSQVEIGTIQHSATLNWSVNKVMTNIVVTGPESYNSANLAPATSGSLPLTINASSNYTYYINIMDSASHTDVANTTLSFLNKAYWGVSSNTTLTNSEIIALSNSLLTTTRVRTITVSPATQYWYYCVPVSFGTPIFSIGGLEVSPIITTQSFTNESLHTSNYYICRSEFTLTGTNISIVIT